MKTVLLDSGPLGLVTNPSGSSQAFECKQWLQSLISTNYRVLVPEIADYEVRRELLRANKIRGLQRLDNLIDQIGYTPITREVMLKAAEFWADARKQGQPTANNQALDADVILAAQAFTISNKGENTVIATTNVRHLTRFVPAKLWNEIT
ncbi:nuclease [Kamptonema animale CS-326]|jgi:predicted nucleic acid-binding protein|uniref:type II toxin-antitoxin system VapC family toxin n=1 Tax=Kamptonema animale TaxID=92934 RepID=UPI00232FF6B1|nr:nuclease [Kamptonema animale]MDB9514568.1 nuclease [Kamptonema animale CS-326]